MASAFPIDFVRQIIRQTLLQEYIKYPNQYIGSENDVSLVSFYEHLASNEEVDRFVDVVRDLNDQQNRTHLIANGVIVSPTNPTITNIYSATIIPLEFNINFRCTLEDRDMVLDTLNHCISVLKGRKHDVAMFDTGKLFMVNTIANSYLGTPRLHNGDYIGEIDYLNNEPVDSFIDDKRQTLRNAPYNFEQDIPINGSYFYYSYLNATRRRKLYVAVRKDGDWVQQNESSDYPNILFPPQHDDFSRYCVSMSFDSVKCSEPRELNAKDYVDISFGGSATIVDNNVMLGNSIVKFAIQKYKLIKSDDGSNDVTYNSPRKWVEPLEMPSGNNAEAKMNQLISNNFINNTHTDNLSITLQYSFPVLKNTILNEFYDYARYGIQTNIKPNIVYKICELYSQWGNVVMNEFNAKIVESIDIENTESDVMTITLPFQLQGDNN